MSFERCLWDRQMVRATYAGSRAFKLMNSFVWNRADSVPGIVSTVFNLTNTPQFDEPQRNLSSASFGRITNTLNAKRILQLGLRIIL